MSVRKLFVGNFDFEHQLAAESRRTTVGARAELSKSARQVAAALATTWVAIANDGDLIWSPSAIAPSFIEHLVSTGLPDVRVVSNERELDGPIELCPWGWSGEMRSWAKRIGASYSAPSAEAVRLVNSRAFSSQLEQAWNVGLTGAMELQTVDEFATALKQMPADNDRWVVKANYSMSARERILGRGQMPDEQSVNWIRKRIQTNGIVFFEPWRERLEEVGVQFDIPQTGEPILLGITPLLTDHAGNYRGSRFGVGEAVVQRWQSTIEIWRNAAKQAQQSGYFGPLGIDAARYRDATGNECFRPLQDINARFTMGRLSLGFRRLLADDEFGTWLHVRWDLNGNSSACEQFENVSRQVNCDVQTTIASPVEVDGQPAPIGTVVLISRSHERLLAAEDLFL